MDPKPSNTNNPYKKEGEQQPLPGQSTLPLEPRLPREESAEDARYMPQPPRPRNFQPQPTVNFPAQPGPRQYDTPASYGNGAPRPQSPAPEPPARERRFEPRPTVTFPAGGHAPQETMPQNQQGPSRPAPRPYPTPQWPPRQENPAQRPDQGGGHFQRSNPTVPAGNNGGAGFGGGHNQPPRPRPTITDDSGKKGGGKLPLIIGCAVALLLLIGGGVWYYIHTHEVKADEEQTQTDINFPSELTDTVVAPPAPAPADPVTDSPGVSDGTESTSLFNRPLTYTGTVSPGGAANLNIILFQNGRLEGSLDYTGGKSMPVYGSYTWTDNGHKMNINFTVSSKTDRGYSESWSGHSSYIKDDLAHTLTFSRINTSRGQSMKANFALRP